VAERQPAGVLDEFTGRRIPVEGGATDLGVSGLRGHHSDRAYERGQYDKNMSAHETPQDNDRADMTLDRADHPFQRVDRRFGRAAGHGISGGASGTVWRAVPTCVHEFTNEWGAT
jgi:hypothetical protein